MRYGFQNLPCTWCVIRYTILPSFAIIAPHIYIFFIFFFLYIQQIKDTTHNKSKRKILTHGQIRTLNQTIQNNRYQPRTPQGTMRYRQSPGPTKNKLTIN